MSGRRKRNPKRAESEVTKEAVVARQAQVMDQLPPIPGEQRVAVRSRSADFCPLGGPRPVSRLSDQLGGREG